MQSDGNLVLFQGSKALWSSGTAGNGGATVTMQTDGNLVVYNGGTATWNSNTAGFSGASLQLQDDGNLVIYHSGHPVWDWGSGYLGNQLIGWTLNPGAYLLSPNHQYELIMQPSDGNLVLYRVGGAALWSTGGAGAGASVTMQSDGNLVVYNGGTAKWNSNTAGFSGANLDLQDDSNLVIYHSGHPVWDWGSGYLGNQLNGWSLGPGSYLLSPNHQYELIMQPSDGNLVLYRVGGAALWSTGGAGAGASAVMQGDGNFVVYNGGTAKWNSQTAAYPGARLVLQDDNNLVIYQGSTAIWDWASGKLVGGGGGGGNQGAAIASIAESQDQYGATVVNNPPTTGNGCNPYTAHWGDGVACSNGLRANAWCADFAAWAWQQAGVSFTYGSGSSDINAWSASFYYWAWRTATGIRFQAGISRSPATPRSTVTCPNQVPMRAGTLGSTSAVARPAQQS
jgi:hypothetical protein